MLIPITSGMAVIVVSINDANINDTTASPTTCSVSYQLTSAGVANSVTTNGGTVALENWITPTSFAGANYEVQATVNSGSLSSGTTGSWLALNTTRTWTVSRSTTGVSTCNLTIEIRRASDSVVLDTVTIALQAARDV